MKTILLATLFCSIIFLIVDILWLSFAVKNFYKPNIGSLLNENPVMWAAILFYAIYVLGLAIVIIYPSIDKSTLYTFFVSTVFGIVSYGTYNLTNMATLKNWSVNVVYVDMIWGGLLTGVSVSIGIYLAKKILS